MDGVGEELAGRSRIIAILIRVTSTAARPPALCWSSGSVGY